MWLDGEKAEGAQKLEGENSLTGNPKTTPPPLGAGSSLLILIHLTGFLIFTSKQSITQVKNPDLECSISLSTSSTNSLKETRFFRLTAVVLQNIEGTKG